MKTKLIKIAKLEWLEFVQGILEGSITIPLASCLTGLDQSVLKIKTKIVSFHTADSKPVKQEVNGTVMLPPLVFPGMSNQIQKKWKKGKLLFKDAFNNTFDLDKYHNLSMIVLTF